MESINEALKTYYLPGLRYQMNEKTTAFYQKIEKTAKNISGVDVELALRYGRQGGIGNRPDDTLVMPTPNSRKTRKAKWGTKNIFATIRLTDKVIKATKDSKNAFASMLELELSDALTDAKDNFNRQLFGDGSGVMATASAVVTASATVPVDSVRFFAEGQQIDFLASADDSEIATGLEVVMVDDITNEITVSSPVTLAVGDKITISGSFDQELTGLGAIMELDSTIYGIDRSANKWLNPYTKAHNNELSFLAMQEIIDRIETRSGNTTDFLMASYGVRRAYIYLFAMGQRTVNTLDLEGGFKALEYNGIPLVADKYQAEGTLDFLTTKNFTLNRLHDWDWIDKNGNVLTRISNSAIYEAILSFYGDLGCDLIRGQGRLTGITEH
jgi:hypothetical protein